MKLSPVEIPQKPKGLVIKAFAVDAPHFAADAASGVIEIFEPIGAGGADPSKVSAALRSIGNRPAIVRLNSPGGDVFAGMTIFNQLRAHKPGVIVEVLGLAASAASVIAMAGDEIRMARASELMIHRAEGGAVGNSDTFKQMSAVLDQVDGVLAKIYADRTGLTVAATARLMADETFMTADQAVGLGFADAVLQRDAAPPPRMSASAGPANKPELEQELRRLGYSRSIANRMTAAAWSARGQDAPEFAVDLERVAAAVIRNFSNLNL
ncbi:MAG: Clp protease ClpP [Alphaproteobacteria bacterium]|nr:Clp protease ClpP [Alphaproteobacteria bacterium]